MAEIRKFPEPIPPDGTPVAPPASPPRVSAARGLPPLPAGSLSESFDDLESRLISRAATEGIRSLLFTGTEFGDGVSTIAARFAEGASRNGAMRVLLVDAELRNPCQHRLFQIGSSDTLAGLLTGEKRIEALAPARHGNLYVLPAGESVVEPRHLFRQGMVDRIVATLAASFDLVVFDAPPITRCAETRALATRVDGNVLVVRAGRSRRRAGRLARQQIEQTGSQFLGVVLNGARQYIPEWLYDRL